MPMKLKAGVVTDVPVAQLERDPNQPRKSFDNDFLARLGASMQKKIEIPLKVRSDGKRLVIVDGEQRWRAAKLVKLKTLPCILDEAGDQLEIAATQLTTVIRQDLKPLDIAEFLAGLQKREKKSMNELQAALAERGLTEIGQAKIERYLRLLELPEWAKDYLRDGTFTESHGHAMMPAAKFPAVLKQLKEGIGRDMNWKGGITAKELAEDVEQAFRIAGTDLNNRYGKEEDIRAFPIEQCRSCEFYKKIGSGEYCLNRKEFDKKQKAGLLLKAEKEARKAERAKDRKAEAVDETDPTKVEPRKVKLSEHNIVALKRLNYQTHRSLLGAHFDLTQCKTCPHRHLASHDGTPDKADGAEDHCFHPPCFDEKERLSRRNESRSDKMRDYLDRWLRPVVTAQAQKRLNVNQQTGIMFWLATGAVDRHSKYYGGQMHEAAAKATEPMLGELGLKDFPTLMEFATRTYGPPHLQQLVTAAIKVMTRAQLRWFAHYIKIEIDDPEFAYRIDEEYLRMKRKSEMVDLARKAGVETVADLGVEGLRRLLLEDVHRHAIGVPEDLIALYREEFEVVTDDDFNDEFEEEFEEFGDGEEFNEELEGAADELEAVIEVEVKTPKKRKGSSK